MKRKTIKIVLIAIPILLLAKCSGIVDDILGEQFPLNINNNGNSVKIHFNKIKNTKIIIYAKYSTNKCSTMRLNAEYTKISYSPMRKTEKIEVKDGVATSVIPVNGGGWCNWKLVNIDIAPVPIESSLRVSSSLVIDVSDTKVNNISYDIILVPFTRIYSSKPDDTYYVLSKKENKSISEEKGGDVYFNAEVINDLATHAFLDKNIIIYPDGTEIYYEESGKLLSPDFIDILENSNLKNSISKEKYMLY